MGTYLCSIKQDEPPGVTWRTGSALVVGLQTLRRLLSPPCCCLAEGSETGFKPSLNNLSGVTGGGRDSTSTAQRRPSFKVPAVGTEETQSLVSPIPTVKIFSVQTFLQISKPVVPECSSSKQAAFSPVLGCLCVVTHSNGPTRGVYHGPGAETKAVAEDSRIRKTVV